MELQGMKTFVTVVRYGSFSKAAESLGYSQGAVTIQVRNLEEELGVRLLDRIGKKISLTNRGSIFYDHAVTVLNEYEKAKEAVEEDTELTGRLRIGTIDSLCAYPLPDQLDAFCAKYRKVQVDVVADTPSVLLEMLGRNELDLVYLLDNPIKDPHLNVTEIQTLPIIFVAAKDHPLADGQPHKLDEVAKYPFIVTEAGASYRRNLDAAFQEKNITMLRKYETNNPSLILSVVDKGTCISFLPEFSIEQKEYKDRIVPIDVPEVSVEIHLQLLVHKEKWVTREMKAFMEML